MKTDPKSPEPAHHVRNVLVHFNTVTLTFDDNAIAHAFAGPYVAAATNALLSGSAKPLPPAASHADLPALLSSLAMQADAAVNLGGDRHMKLTLVDIAERLLSLAAQPSIRWEPIKTAPKDGSVILVDDANGGAQWAAAKWMIGEEWSGWIYDDDIMNDTQPLGPNPTRWLRGLSTAELPPMIPPVNPGPLLRVMQQDADRWRRLEEVVDAHGVIVAVPDSCGERIGGSGINNAGDLQNWIDSQLPGAPS